MCEKMVGNGIVFCSVWSNGAVSDVGVCNG